LDLAPEVALSASSQNLLLKLREKISEQNVIVSKLFVVFDTNQDNQFSLSEFLRLYEMSEIIADSKDVEALYTSLLQGDKQLSYHKFIAAIYGTDTASQQMLEKMILDLQKVNDHRKRIGKVLRAKFKSVEEFLNEIAGPSVSENQFIEVVGKSVPTLKQAELEQVFK